MAWVQNKKEYVNISDKYPPFPWGYKKSHSDVQDSVIIVHFNKNSFRLSYFLFWSCIMELVDTNANSISANANALLVPAPIKILLNSI